MTGAATLINTLISNIGPLLEVSPAQDVPVLPANVQQQIQPEAAHSKHAYSRPGAGL